MIQELETRYGTMFVPDTDRGQYWWLANTGASPEDSFIDMVCGLIDERPRGTAVDVGANFGCWSLPLSRHAHSVVAIEPQQVVVKLLGKSIAASAIKNIRVYMCAAGERPGSVAVPELSLEDGTNFGGISVDVACSEQPEAPLHSVPVIRLDDLLQGEQVSFIKADVEGYEERVLRGARETIARCKPLLFVEMDHARTDAAKLQSLIEGYEYFVEKQGGNFLGVPT